MNSVKKYKLAIVASHLIQYQAPLFMKIAKDERIDLTVYFCSDKGLRASKDPGFGIKFAWDRPLLEGYRYIFLKNISLPFYFSTLTQFNFGLFKELRKSMPDAIIIHTWLNIVNWFLIFSTIPVFLRTETPQSHELVKNPIKLFVKRELLKLFFSRIKAFLYIGESNKEFYLSHNIPPKKMFFTPYSVDNRWFFERYKELCDKKYELKQRLQIDASKNIVLFCGKFIDKKCPFDLLYAFQKMKFSSKALLFVGDGNLRQSLEKYVKDNRIKDVYFVGFKNQSELPEYYAMADMLVLPSGLGETWGLVVNEAMCFHLPVVVSDLVGCEKDLIRHNYNGFVFPLGDIDTLSGYLDELAGDKEKRTLFGNRSALIINNYSYEKDVEGIFSAIDNIVTN